ncbi:MAG TPA: class E sortase [Mycobacteriales bacterium]|nr:class E sortase [Mycobacteriales bacterium]
MAQEIGSSTSPTASFLPMPAAAPRTLGALVGLSMRRAGGRRAASAVTVLLLLSGVSMFAFPAVTDVFNRYQQRHVKFDPSSPTFQQLYEEHRIPVSKGLTRLVIDNSRVKVNTVVVEGTTLAALEAGAGHYVNTPYPCEQGNVGIAGHRTTYGRPFNKIDQMRPGDTVDLITPFATCTYQAVRPFGGHSNPWVVLPNDYQVVGQSGVLGTGEWLTLTSCHPLGSDSHRIVLRLKLIKKVYTKQSKASAQ